MKYKEQLISYLKNIDGNLNAEYTDDFSSTSDAFGETMAMAASSDSNKKLLSIILFQQITMEFMKRLIIYSNFLERLCLYPNKKNHGKISEDAKFSEVIAVFKSLVEFKNKNKLISNILKINRLRNKYAHNIAFQHNIYTSLEDIEELQPYDLFNSMFNDFSEGIADLRKKIELAKKNSEIQKLLN